MKVIKFIRAHPLRSSGILVLVAGLLCGIVILASMLARPAEIFRHTDNNSDILADDKDIGAWARFDKPSYHVGEIITQYVRVLYRNDKVVPDLDSINRRMSFFPLEQRSSTETTVVHDNGITEYQLVFELQGVRVDPQQTYRVDPFTLYYNLTNSNDDNIYSQVIQPPPVQFSAYYPLNLEAVDLLPYKDEINTAETLRQIIMGSAAILLLCLSVFLLWHYGRRRTLSEITEEERLWRVYSAVDSTSLDNRTALLNYEQVFTRLLYIQTNITPEAFWAGSDPDDESWKTLTITTREILLENYQTIDPENSEVEKIKSLLGERLSSLVSESRLLIEEQPGYLQRIRQQPMVVSYASILVVLALIIFTLNINPDLWLSSELKQYNSLTRAISDDDVNVEESYLALSAMGDQAINNTVKYAALYNAGTLLAVKSFSLYAQGQEKLILNSVIRSDTVEELFHTLLEGPFDEESQIVSILTDGAEQLRRAQLDLQAAIRINPYGEDSQRNLEVAVKRRELIIDKLSQIREFYRSQREEGEEEALSDEGIINLLEAELSEDEEEESSGKDDRGYMILERF